MIEEDDVHIGQTSMPIDETSPVAMIDCSIGLVLGVGRSSSQELESEAIDTVG